MSKAVLGALWGATATLWGTASAFGGGIDRSGQSLDALFKDSNYAELSYAWSSPDLSGKDLAQDGMLGMQQTPGVRYDNVGGAFQSPGFALLHHASAAWSFAVIGAEDYGADIHYPDIDGSLLGGTKAEANTFSLSLIARYALSDRLSAHGGLRIDRANGEIGLDGLTYGGPSFAIGGSVNTAQEVFAITGGAANSNAVSGYDVKLGNSLGFGYLVGGAYEIPEIALRIAVTYFSEITHDFDTTETFAVDTNGDRVADGTETYRDSTKVTTPQAINIDFQTGIAADTLLFGSFRWADWSEFQIAPPEFKKATGVGLVTVEDARTYEIGLARRFGEKLAASIAYSYDDVDGDDLVSPLSPSYGYQALALGASYRLSEQLEISGGMKYFWLGDAYAETGNPDVARAEFFDNTSVSLGLRLGYYF